jgi:regulator of RNase E activity RraB
VSGSERVERIGDRAILKKLLKRGDDPAKPRHTVVFFYRRGDDERSAELAFNPLALRLQTLGWSVIDLGEDAVIAEAHRPVDPDAINAMSETMEGLAHEFGVVFDGWECALLQGEDDE